MPCPDMHIHAFSPMEIVYGVELTGMPLPDYLKMLRDNGLDTLPGTAAEILDDDVRFVLSRNKLSTAQWKEVIRTAHQCGIRSTSTLMYGHVETPDALGQSALASSRNSAADRRLHRVRSAGLRAQNTLLFQQGLARPGPTLAEHLKIHALARVMLAGSINNIQVSWVKLNRQLVATLPACRRQRLRRHVDGRKHFARSRSHGRAIHQPEEFQSLILETGRIPAERNTTYTRINIKLPLDNLPSRRRLEPEFA